MMRSIVYFLLFSVLLFRGSLCFLYAEGNSEASPPASEQTSENQVHGLKESESEAEAKEEKMNPGKLIMDHISDSHEWHFFDLNRSDGSEFHGRIFLPVILFTPGEGLSVFSFKKLHHSSYKGFSLDADDHIVRTDDKKFYDFSLTKNVIQMLIAVLLMLLIFMSVARNYNKYGTKAPKGINSAVEVIVIFIRDQVAKPLLGANANKYLPYLLMLSLISFASFNMRFRSTLASASRASCSLFMSLISWVVLSAVLRESSIVRSRSSNA
jgi:F-type H+-transporting ATPase subunit a